MVCKVNSFSAMSFTLSSSEASAEILLCNDTGALSALVWNASPLRPDL